MKQLLFFFQAYKSLTVGDIPDYIAEMQRDLCAILVEISEAHFESALQAIRAYEVSRRQTEIESAITHLRDVFNIAKRATNKEVRYSYLFGLISGSKPAYRHSERIMIILYLSMIAKLISRIYLLLGETENAEFWLKQGRALGSDMKPLLDVSAKVDYDWKRNTGVEQLPDGNSDFRQALSSQSERILLHLYEADGHLLNFEETEEKFASASGAVHRLARVQTSLSEKGRQFLLDKLQ
jgi:hypothetical protein